jgi:hypothetical protein
MHGLSVSSRSARPEAKSNPMLRIVLLLISVSLAASAAEVQHHPRTGLSWKVRDRGFSLTLVQLSPDFVHAVYEGRGLPAEIVRRMGQYCVFGTIVRNETHKPLSYRVADWRCLTPVGEQQCIKTKTEWINEWRRLGVPFMWSILPDAQTFEPGDWGQGFTTVKLSHGSAFDLIYSWSQDHETHTGKIVGLRCAQPGRDSE